MNFGVCTALLCGSILLQQFRTYGVRDTMAYVMISGHADGWLNLVMGLFKGIFA